MFKHIPVENLQPYLDRDPTFFTGVKSLGEGRSKEGFQFIGGPSEYLPGEGARGGAMDVYYIDPSIQGTQRNLVYSSIQAARTGMGYGPGFGFFVTDNASLLEDTSKAAVEKQTLSQPIEMQEAERSVAPETGPAKVRQRRAKGRTILDERIGADIILGG